MGNSSSLRVARWVPQRTCVACRKIRDKRELLRLVPVPGGGVEVDTGGRKPGRGAYLCPTRECWQRGLKSGRLEHSLRTALTPDNREQLVKFGEASLGEQVSDRSE